MSGSAGRSRNSSTVKTSLSPGAVVDGALSLAEEEGLEAVTIRRLAKDLGVTPMALYWHFGSKDELLDGMAERLFEEIDLNVDDAVTWQEQLRGVLGSLARVLRAHSAAAALVTTRTVSSDNSLRATEVLLDILRRAGFSPPEATQVARHALSTIANLVSGMPGVVAGDESAEQADARRSARALLETLPPERYPRLIEAAAPLSECEDPDAYFTFGLDLLMAGIEAMAARRGPVDAGRS